MVKRLLALVLALLLPAQSWAAAAPKVVQLAASLSAPAPRGLAKPPRELQLKTALLLKQAGLEAPAKIQAGPALQAAASILADVTPQELSDMPAEQAQAIVSVIFDAMAGGESLSAEVPALSALPVAPSASFLKPSGAGSAGPQSHGLVELLESPSGVKALLKALAPGARIDPVKWAREARRRFLSPPGTEGSGKKLPAAAEKALDDLALITAEGVTRTAFHHKTAGELREAQLSAGWQEEGGAAVADVVVVGAGPAGLALGLHSAQAGLKTVVFEGGFVGQSFSDAAMKSVYRMRTPAARNSLAQAPFSPPELVASAGMLAKLAWYRARGQLMDSQRDRRTGRPALGGARQGLEGADPSVASARNELLQHFADGAAAIEGLGGFVQENTPVTSVFKREDGLWEIRAGAHRQLARKLALAQGQVGTESQFAAIPGDLEKLAAGSRRWVVLRDRRSLSGLRRLSGGKFVIHDSLLGQPKIESLLARQPKGATVMIIGSGESAVKGAMAVLRLHPGLKVALFVQSDLRPAQLQIPAAHASPEAIAKAMTDPAYAEQTLREWQEFGAPVTPGTLADLEEQKKLGRLAVYALGKKCVFDDTVKVRELRRGLEVYTDDPEIIRNLQARGQGRLLPDGSWKITDINGPIVAAVGYSRKALRRDPLTRQLLDAGRLKVKGGEGKAVGLEFTLSKDLMTSSEDADLYVLGAQNFAFSADSAIPGAVARAAETAKHLKAALAGPPAPKTGEKGKRRWWFWGAAAVGLNGLAVSAVELAAQAAYYVANVLSFLFIIPQIHKVVKNRSADVAMGTMLVGLVSAALCAVNFAYDDKPLMVYRNVAQTLGFAAVVGLKLWYDARKGAPAQGAGRAIAVTALLVAGLTAAMFLVGPALLAALPGAAWMKGLALAFQLTTGLGYAYLLVPQLLKLERDRGTGDASALMTAGFLGTRTIGIWAFATLMGIVGAANLGLLALYPLIYGPAAYFFMKGLAAKQGSKWATFGKLAAFFTASVGLGALGLWALVPEGSGERFLMYMFYLTHNVTALAASVVTLRSFKKYAKK